MTWKQILMTVISDSDETLPAMSILVTLTKIYFEIL